MVRFDKIFLRGGKKSGPDKIREFQTPCLQDTMPFMIKTDLFTPKFIWENAYH